MLTSDIFGLRLEEGEDPWVFGKPEGRQFPKKFGEEFVTVVSGRFSAQGQVMGARSGAFCWDISVWVGRKQRGERRKGRWIPGQL